ncbi:unnamed protein product [Paramecium sonneborni]|uniref:GPI mannosyltransferase 2 n=1 Tax=Paramecium sonneborni TaxID=65129 RepID=A0A8S1PZW8_9CILI|nr:unnamed protein product [Paramecium sonneborni]
MEIMENYYRYFKNHAFGYEILLIRKLFSNSLICILILQKICNSISSELIYRISMHYSNNNQKFSLLSVILLIFTPASVFFNSLYKKAYFTFLVLLAIYLQIKQKPYLNSFIFTQSIYLRSNGTFFILFLVILFQLRQSIYLNITNSNKYLQPLQEQFLLLLFT